ncbi:coenzyme F420-0:L-glutamate ligase [Candidatus Nomurabacteria bacterium]|nr:coenzyme F420-0:L-glutamate ligase [Candidatus Kaiserbacteria bacterium]MCB9815197.1 coenzyme F420-0:L-glutamate ligase [Candidatus Nomurabacteria bacterium]
MNPPKDDLFAVLDESLTSLREGDVVVISSKVVAINEGRCVTESDFDSTKHNQEKADVIIPRSNWNSPLTIINNVMVGNSGVDRSNSNGYVTMLPAEPFVSAREIYNFLIKKFALKNLGVIIADSHSVPCRYGAMGVAISFWGIHPLQNHIGKEDLFGRKIKVERSNLVDGITAGATVVMGEVAECMPVVIVRDVPNVEFVDADCKDELFCSFEDDVFNVLYERFLS